MAYLALFVALGGTAYAANEWTGANIVDESLTGADIQGKAGTAVTPAVNGSLTTDDIAGQQADAANGTPFIDGTLTTWDVKDHSLKRADLAGGLIGNTELAADSVTGAKVADGSLTGPDLAAGAIGATQLAPDAVAGGKVLDGSLSSADVQDESLTSADIGSNAVGKSEIATDAVGPTEVQDSSIDSGEIVDNSLTANDLAPNSVGSSELASDAVGSSEVANGSLTLADIKGADILGTFSLGAGAIPVGGCKDFAAATPGSKVNEAVVISLRGSVAQGMLFYGVRVAVADQTTVKVCNFTGATSPTITNLPVRTVTFG